MEWMQEAYRLTRKDGVPGVDGLTAKDYEAKLEANLRDLLERIKSGRYQAPPVRRAFIPKADGTQRPLGIPTFEDKVAQRAIVMALEAVYEQDFLDCSFGFRPGRSAHQALQRLRNACMEQKLPWVLEVDLRKYFDTIPHGFLRSFLDRRVTDGVLRRMIDKWLKAGVLEEGRLQRNEMGSPQGGVISPLLANIFLHHVLDEWFESEVRPRLAGKSMLVRYADDFVMAFESFEDAQRVRAALVKRLGRYGLELHADKTRFIDFRKHPPADKPRTMDRDGQHPRPQATSFDFLGFTLVWGKSRKGNRVIRLHTAKSRFARALAGVNEWCRRNRHRPIPEQQARLSAMMRGHYAYYGVTGNVRRLQRYAAQIRRIWKKWLSRRDRKGFLAWSRMQQLLDRHPLPLPRIVHRYAVGSESLS